MGERPLTEYEVNDLRERVAEAKQRLAPLLRYITSLEQQLADGTTWTHELDPEEEKRMEEDCKAFMVWLYEDKPMPKLYEYKWSWLKETR